MINLADFTVTQNLQNKQKAQRLNVTKKEQRSTLLLCHFKRTFKYNNALFVHDELFAYPSWLLSVQLFVLVWVYKKSTLVANSRTSQDVCK